MPDAYLELSLISIISYSIGYINENIHQNGSIWILLHMFTTQSSPIVGTN